MSPYVPFVVLWVALALVVIGLIVYRRIVSAGEDDFIHVSDVGGSMASQQVALAQRLEQIDKWGKTLTAVTVVYGLILGAVYVYQSWVSGV
jgi:hypothetical protein